jgi:hypothetical protein
MLRLIHLYLIMILLMIVIVLAIQQQMESTKAAIHMKKKINLVKNSQMHGYKVSQNQLEQQMIQIGHRIRYMMMRLHHQEMMME